MTDTNQPIRRRKPRGRNASSVFTLALMVAVALTVTVEALEASVVQQISAGSIRSVSIGGGLRTRMVVETEMGFFPVFGAIRIERGAPVVLQERRLGDWFICDEKLTSCVLTSKHSWSQAAPPHEDR